MPTLKEKFINAFTFSHYGNKKNFEKKIKTFSEAIKYNNEIILKIVSDFRTAHMNIIAGMIAFLGFINKDGITENINFKYGFIALLIFIVLSIISILLSFYFDVFSFKQRSVYMDKYLRGFIKGKTEVEKFEFSKDKAKKFNEELLEYNPPVYRKIGYFINGLFWLTWIILIYGLYNIIIYYIHTI